ncbi:unnamed protein product [Allacma fusca]|uniref:Uncharacterized protein n=1 Tax=Allacma fusca TaxID=39272 RepID=A0A8J2PMU1_9HEXA|nr:unnamed protein product [Allacma fusca]
MFKIWVIIVVAFLTMELAAAACPTCDEEPQPVCKVPGYRANMGFEVPGPDKCYCQHYVLCQPMSSGVLVAIKYSCPQIKDRQIVYHPDKIICGDCTNSAMCS